MFQLRHVDFTNADNFILYVVFAFDRNSDSDAIYDYGLRMRALNLLDDVLLQCLPSVMRHAEAVKQPIVSNFPHFRLGRHALVSAGLQLRAQNRLLSLGALQRSA